MRLKSKKRISSKIEVTRYPNLSDDMSFPNIVEFNIISSNDTYYVQLNIDVKCQYSWANLLVI